MIAQREYELFKHYRATGYRWIARDKNKMLHLYNYKPFKGNSVWETVDDGILCSYILNSCRADIFKSITWEDEEPTRIDDLIRDYESHQVITGGNNLQNNKCFIDWRGYGEDSEPYCESCDIELFDEWNHCPLCGRKIYSYIDGKEIEGWL